MWQAVLIALLARVDADGFVVWGISVDSAITRVHRSRRRGREERGDLRVEPPDAPGGGDELEDHALGRSRGGWISKLHLACEQGRKPLSLLSTAGGSG